MGYYVPKTLQERNLWGVWRKEDGRKVPYSADQKYNGKISKTAAWQWKPYDVAVAKLEYSGDYNGLGFLFTKTGGLVFIDLDHCINEDGEPNDFAAEIVEMFKGSYIEYSQSETGLHIVVRGYVPAVLKEKTIEIYGNGAGAQYMAFTGNAYEANEPQPAQRQLNELIRRFDIKAKAEAQPVADQPVTSDDERILQLLTDDRTNDNAAQFRALWAGQLQPCTVPNVERCAVCPLYRKQGRLCFRSQSEADYRLIRMIKAYSRNYEQTARLFRNSALNRAKATDEYIRRIFDYVPRNAVASPQEARNGQKGTNTPPTEKNAVRGEYEPYRRPDITDTEIKVKSRPRWK